MRIVKGESPSSFRKAAFQAIAWPGENSPTHTKDTQLETVEKEPDMIAQVVYLWPLTPALNKAQDYYMANTF